MIKIMRALREHLRQYDPDSIHAEPWCSCGAPNHARIFLFRVDGQPATALVPEAFELTSEAFGRILPGAKVERISEAEIENACELGELGRMQPFENPFGGSVYIDQELLKHEAIVFCPRMFNGKRGQCYRVPTRDLLSIILPTIMEIAPSQAAIASANIH